MQEIRDCDVCSGGYLPECRRSEIVMFAVVDTYRNAGDQRLLSVLSGGVTIPLISDLVESYH